MPKFIIFGGNGMLANAFRRDSFFADHIAVDIEDCDITDFNAVERMVAQHKPKYIINCAAFTDVTRSETELTLAMSINADGAGNLSQLSNKYNSQLIHFSTDFVFRGDEDIVYTEDMTPNPVNNYGLSKLRGEEAITFQNPTALIIRVSWLYGAGGKNFVSTISDLMRRQKQVRIVFDQYGKTTYTCDAVTATKNLILTKATGLFHFANSGVCSRYEFATKILEILQRKEKIDCAILPIKSTEYLDPTPRPTYSVLGCQKYSFLTGENIRHWEDALEEYLKVRS